MVLQRPLYMEAAPGDSPIAYTAQQDRAGLLGSLFSREGVLDKDGGHLLVTQRLQGAAMSVDVAPGRCAIVGDDISDQGTYVCASTTPENLTVPPRPASGSRTHRLVARVRDKLATGVWQVYDWTLEILPDTGGGTPSIPNSAISLATITVSSSATAITNTSIVDTRLRASVGTPAITGTWLASGVHAGWGGRDASRPLTWAKNPDGWVFLGGWLRRSGGNYTASMNQTLGLDANLGVNNPMTSPALPPEARPTGVRDFIGLTSNGYCHYAVYPSGVISLRFNYQTVLTQNVTWLTFDGCNFRANSFG